MPIEHGTYVVARSNGRPTLMHRVMKGDPERTACGQNVGSWSRAFTRKPIAEILCLKARCRA